MLRTLCFVILCCLLAETTAVAGENPEYAKLVQQGRAEYVDGRYAAAETLFLAALGTLQKNDERERANTLLELGDVYTYKDELPKAERAYSESLTIYKRLPEKPRTALVLRNLGAVYSLQGRNDDAQRILQQALKEAKETRPLVTPLVAQILNTLGIAQYRIAKYDKAESFFNQAMELVSATGVPFQRGELLNNLAAVSQAKRDYRKAEDLYMESLRLTEAAVGPSHPDLTFTLSMLGILYTDAGKYTDAEKQFRRALEILGDAPMFESRNARLLHRLAGMYAKAGREAEADATLGQAASIARRNIDQHTDMAVIVEAYSATLKNAGKTTEAEELRAEARRAMIKAGLVINAHNPF